ncbi:regulatory signaling modulator protein AmpE [Thiohalophilus thiocyanatoxydans]|uniref:Adenosylcobinamide-phosphate synthase/AmpE protein n=1 Tax=Thiohalophilus thiocyanatoxydans TaxID=381308 RepID=A0A4V3H3D5_9GAMM|nr:regulatory signaling modulator protein AmpE [Thiohalophilus thiocyanatoxydans]TDX97903.1 adenosylcobinamide-phosphate synthase/AmpE protein [Thiohalophilus thiocyanatoxydans]
MNLISILLALAVELFYKPVSDLRRFDWFDRYHETLYHKLDGQPLRDGPVGVILLVGLVALAVWIVLAALGALTGLLAFLFGLAVLIFTLGPRHLDDDAQQVLDALERGDTEAALLNARQLGDETEITAESKAELVQQVRDRILVEANTRIFGVLFWFLILGPIGAVLFRLSCQVRQQASVTDEYRNATRDLYRILAWIPARLTVLCYALAGNFVNTLSRWQSPRDLWEEESDAFLIASGNGAIQGEYTESDEETEINTAPAQNALALVKRALVVWVVLLALLTLMGLTF